MLSHFLLSSYSASPPSHLLYVSATRLFLPCFALLLQTLPANLSFPVLFSVLVDPYRPYVVEQSRLSAIWQASVSEEFLDRVYSRLRLLAGEKVNVGITSCGATEERPMRVECRGSDWRVAIPQEARIWLEVG